MLIEDKHPSLSIPVHHCPITFHRLTKLLANFVEGSEEFDTSRLNDLLNTSKLKILSDVSRTYNFVCFFVLIYILYLV